MGGRHDTEMRTHEQKDRETCGGETRSFGFTIIAPEF